LTVPALEERVVAVHSLWRRTPGGGASPFAKDIPAHLMLREVGDILGQYSETLLVNEAGKELLVRKIDQRAPRAALSSADVAERDLLMDWIGLVPGIVERALVWRVTVLLDRGEELVPWRRVVRPEIIALARRLTSVLGDDGEPILSKEQALDWERHESTIAWRYKMQLSGLLCRFHGLHQRNAKLIAQRGVSVMWLAA
jgi:hypothetical protein